MSSENKSISTVLAIAACALSLAANADTFWKGQGADSDFYNRDNWINWWNANYVFGGGQLGNLPADGSYVTFTNAAAIAQGLWIENANKGGVEWSLAENAAEGAGLTITNNLTVGTGKAGQLTVKDGEYLVRGDLKIANGNGADNNGTNSILVIEGGTFDVNGFVNISDSSGFGELVVKGGVFNSNKTRNDGDDATFGVCKGYNGGTATKGRLVVDGGIVNIAHRLYSNQESGASYIEVKSGELNVAKSAVLGRGWYNSSSVDLTISGGKFHNGGYLDFAPKTNGHSNEGTFNMTGGELVVGGDFLLAGDGSTVDATMTGGNIVTTNKFIVGREGTCDFNMSGGSITTVNNELYIGGADTDGKGSAVFTMTGGSVSNLNSYTSISRRHEGTLNLQGGDFYSKKTLSVARYAVSTGMVDMTGGHFATGKQSDGNLIVGHRGEGTFIMGGGVADVGWEFWIGDETNSDGTFSDGTFIMTNGTFNVNRYTCVGYGGGGIGHFIMNGGTYTQSSEKFIVGQSNGAAGTYGECIVSNGTITVPTLWIAENKKPGTLMMEGGTFNVTGEAQLSRNNGASEGKIELNGGTLSVNYFSSSSGTGGEIVFNGGTLAARVSRENFIPNIANLKLTIAAGGAVIDTDGHNVTIADTFENANELEGNGTIAKKGLGTLTISSNLDLERTFKFTIDTDLGAAGVGPIALTGSNTLDAGDKITVEIDPVNAETNLAYTVMTGLGELTMDDIVLAGTDFYSYTGEVTDGTLTVTLQYGPTAPITARYDNGAWGVYNYNNELIPNGTATNLTTYVFNGSEPAGDLATYASGHKVFLESGTIAIDSAVLAGHVAVADGATVTIDASGAASLVADSLVNNGTLVFNGDITIDAPLSSGTISIAESAALHLTKSQNPSAIFEGMGELMLENITIHVLNTSYFKDFHGTIAIGNNATLYDDVEFHCENKAGANHAWYGLGENTTIKMAGGSIARFSDRGSNNEYIGNVVIAEGTTNTWSNSSSRGSAWEGVNLELKGTFSGAGTLQAYCGGRHYRFESDLTEFAGTVEMSGSAFGFRYGIKGGTWIANPTAVLYDNLSVSNATLDNNSNVISTGTYTIGADATLKVADDASVEGITFAAGATLELLDDGALSDKTQTYVALTSKTPIPGPLPSLVQSEGNRGKWKLEVREIPAETEEGSPTYQLVASFRPKGFVIIID